MSSSGGAEVDQVAGVGQHVVQREAARRALVAERGGLVVGERLGGPAPLVAGEDGKSVGAEGARPFRRAVHAAGSGYVSTEQFHGKQLAVGYGDARGWRKGGKDGPGVRPQLCLAAHVPVRCRDPRRGKPGARGCIARRPARE